jgi:hypothetical protein
MPQPAYHQREFAPDGHVYAGLDSGNHDTLSWPYRMLLRQSPLSFGPANRRRDGMSIYPWALAEPVGAVMVDRDAMLPMRDGVGQEAHDV